MSNDMSDSCPKCGGRIFSNWRYSSVYDRLFSHCENCGYEREKLPVDHYTLRKALSEAAGTMKDESEVTDAGGGQTDSGNSARSGPRSGES